MNYFWNVTLQSYFETPPLVDVQAYIAKELKEREWEIVEVPQQPCFCHDWIDGSWVLDGDRRRDADIIEVRATRDFKLRTEVDPLAGNALRWADLTNAKRAEWTQYRTDLLNVPQQSGFPSTINWPTKPTE